MPLETRTDAETGTASLFHFFEFACFPYLQAIINNRKQKIIPSYELEIKLNWEGEAAGQAAKGKVRLPQHL